MTDQEYFKTKKAICDMQNACNTDCPLFRYMDEQGIHACGCLCDVLEQTDLNKAKEIARAWLAEHPVA